MAFPKEIGKCKGVRAEDVKVRLSNLAKVVNKQWFSWCQAQRFLHYQAGQKPRIGGDSDIVEFQPEPTVKIQPQRP